ncbi:MAG: MerR family DNA-binding transcriptional regulator [Planctomycetota bacterium]
MTQHVRILRIGALAERFGVSPESLRVWERQGLIPAAYRTPGGHRRYGVEHVRAITRLIYASEPVAMPSGERVPPELADQS